jgi:hypothetical protein
MTTVFIDENTEKGRSLLNFLKKFNNEDFIVIEDIPNKETKRAIQDSRKGKVTKTTSVSDLMDKLNQ